MKKTILTLILAALLCIGFAVTAHAAPQDSTDILLIDNAALLSEEEAEALLEELERVSADQQTQIIIVTVDSMDGEDIDEFVEYLYDEMAFGYGVDRDGVLLLVSMDPQEYRILSNGSAARAIQGGEIEAIGDAIRPDLSAGNYALAFFTFAGKCEYYINGYVNGFPFDFGQSLAIALIIGIIVGVIVAFTLKGQLKSVRKQHAANAYVKTNSMQITQASDFFLYRNITRTRRQSSTSSGSRSGGSRHVGGGRF